MDTVVTTGRAAALLGTTEPALNDLIRRGKVTPPPEVVAGRRLWQPEHIRQAADHLGVLTAELRAKLEAIEEGSSDG